MSGVRFEFFSNILFQFSQNDQPLVHLVEVDVRPEERVVPGPQVAALQGHQSLSRVQQPGVCIQPKQGEDGI